MEAAAVGVARFHRVGAWVALHFGRFGFRDFHLERARPSRERGGARRGRRALEERARIRFRTDANTYAPLSPRSIRLRLCDGYPGTKPEDS